jgi:hypothetical protein
MVGRGPPTLPTLQFNRGRVFDEILTKVLRVFLLVIHSHLYSFAFRVLLLQTHTTSTLSTVRYCTL